MTALGNAAVAGVRANSVVGRCAARDVVAERCIAGVVLRRIGSWVDNLLGYTPAVRCVIWIEDLDCD